MTRRIPEDFSAAEWGLVTIMGNTMPPRGPNDDDDDEDEDNDTEPDAERQPPREQPLCVRWCGRRV